jgi:pectate lyase
MKYFLTILFFTFVTVAVAQDYCMTTPVGYGRNATGGAGGTVKTVKTVSELKSALTASGAAIIIVTENITFGASDMINAAISNKTLLGLKGVKLIQNNDGGILGLNSGSTNVIIRNLIFEGPGAYDIDGNDLLSNKGCNNLWVDHCEFYDGLDGNFDNTSSSDNISISWCKFGYNKPARTGGSGGSSDHRFTNLVSSGPADAPSDGRRSITFHYCYWTSGCKSRMPRARNADLHLLNCLNDSQDASPAIGLGGGTKGLDCYVEGSVFENIKSLYSSYNSSDGGTHTLTYVDCSSSKSMSNVGTAPKPAYTYTALPKEEVKDAVKGTCGAGATLDITSSGTVSSPCSTDNPPETLGIPQNVTATATATSIRISWNVVTGATGYRIKLSYENTSDPGNTEPSVREWDFTAPWTIDADDADDNLVLDTDNNGRFNYKPATNNEELKFATGAVIPDLAGLRFTAGATSKLRLGFATGLIYLNGSGIKAGIPCSTGDRITVEGLSSNATATNRGFSVSGATVYEAGTSDNITDGILTVAGATGVWAYTATANLVELTTAGGGMNISKITVTSSGGASGSGEIITNEYTVEGGNVTEYTIDNLIPDTEYTYQVKALRNSEESAYSEAATIDTRTTTLLRPEQVEWQILQTANELTVTGIKVMEINLYDLSGKKLRSVNDSQSIDVSPLSKGFYILSVRLEDNRKLSKKTIKH